MDSNDDSNESLAAPRPSFEHTIRLLHRVASLVRSSLELEPTIYAILTATTAGEGLGLNRAMLFLRDSGGEGEGASRRDGALRGVGAVGPRDDAEADRIWRSIEAEGPDLSELFAAGLAQLERRDETTLDGRIRALRIDLDGASPIALALRTGEVIVGGGEDDLDGLLDLGTGVAAPLIGRDGPMGVLFADNMFTCRTLDATTQMVLDLVADHAARAIEAARLYERVAHQARVDALTGLPHHGSLMDALDVAVAAAAEAGGSLGVIMIDVDDFKAVNDAHGHLVGDALLGYFAGRIKGVVRSPEHVYRYGGEELTVLVPGGDAKATVMIAERICEAIRHRPFSLTKSGADGEDGEPMLLPMTCSLGVAAYPSHASDALTLLRAADDALLEAKRAGKNRVLLAE